MSVTPPLHSEPIASSSEADANASSPTGRWGTVTGDMRSPPPAPSSGAGVRRNHTIHGPRHHGKPRLEKHFEQPEDSASGPTRTDGAAPSPSAPRSTRFNEDQPLHGLHASPSSKKDVSLANSSSFSIISGNAAEFVPSLTPLQALYSKSSVSRNLSLPTRHSTKLTTNVPNSSTQGRTSQFNSLSAITGGADVDEHDWEKLIHSSNALGDEHQQDPNAQHSLSPPTDQPWSSSLFSTGQLGAPAASSHPTSPITGTGPFSEAYHRDGSVNGVDLFGDTQALGGSASFLRRHQSLNQPAARSAAQRLAARSSDLRSRYVGDSVDRASSSHSSQTDAAFSPPQHTTSFSATNSPVMPSSYSKAPWNQPTQDPIGSPSRFAGPFPSQNIDASQHRLPSGVDGSSSSLAEVSNNLSKLDISGSSALGADGGSDSSNLTSHSVFRDSATNISSIAGGQPLGGRKLPQLVTSRDALQRGQRTNGFSGPMSAAAYVPPIGHAHGRQPSNDPFASEATLFDGDSMQQRFGPFTAGPTGGWLDKDSLAGRIDDSSGAQAWPQQATAGAYQGMGVDPNVLALSMALAQEQKRNAELQAQLGSRTRPVGSQEPQFFGMQPIDLNGPIQSIGQQLRAGALPSSPPMGGVGHLPSRGQPFSMQQSPPSFRPPMHAQGPPSGPASGPSGDSGDAPTPVDATSLALQKGYNPPPGSFPAPANARFFVIKSYTEDDVHKSLKYEIWASTDKGNQRLDKAFRESAQAGPIYLFYSVNASGHFCGMAQMLTPLDYATSSNVWAQDGKWKGTFKVRWIYVKDLPNNQLRHIRLTNTPECKPVTQSRDTQELTPEAGREVLRIMSEYGAKTSLLQDFNFYEMQGRPGVSPPAMPVARPGPSSSPAIGMGGLPLRNSPTPQGLPALGLAFPTSPNARAASPNGFRRAPPSGTPQRPHGVSGLGLATGTPRSNARQINDLRSDSNGSNDVSAAQKAGLAPSAI